MSTVDSPSSSSTPHPSSHPYHHRRHAYPQFLAFGDSITQQAEYSLLPPIRDRYMRRLDVLNRGFSGYNSPYALRILPRFFPTILQAHVRLMYVFFGANDACLPGNLQHVPLDKYVESLEAIILHQGVKAHGTKVVLIIPGPVDEWRLIARMSDGGTTRTAANTKKYADACREVGKRLKVPVVDLWRIIMTKAGWSETPDDNTGDTKPPLPGSKAAPRNETLAQLLPDGLHFSAEAYGIMYKELVHVIAEAYPEETPERLPMVFPDWHELMDGSKRLDD